jgi:hypothetical protein
MGVMSSQADFIVSAVFVVSAADAEQQNSIALRQSIEAVQQYFCNSGFRLRWAL